jgi:hypothetical protein
MYNSGNSSKNVTGSSVVDGTLESADFADNGLSGDKIDGGIISNFQSTGIDDNATSTKLTVSNTAITQTAGTALNSATGVAGVIITPSGWQTLHRFGVLGTSGNKNYMSTNYNANTSAVDDAGYGTSQIVTGSKVVSISTGDTNTAPSARISIGLADVTIKTGNIVMATAGKGIDFSAADTALAGTTANILDDYETGTWTPIIDGATGTPTITYTTNNSHYTKVGRLVTCRCEIVVTNVTGTTTGNMTISLPFVGVSGQGCTGAYSASGITLYQVGTGAFQLYSPTHMGLLTGAGAGAGWGWESVAVLGTSCTIRVSFSYMV